MIQEMLKYFLAIALLSVTAAHAARPMVTDDARVVDPRSCQLESWVRVNRASTEYWLMPGCNVAGRFELSAGGARGHDDAGTTTTDVVYQAKALLRPLDTDGWGLAATVGTVRHPAIDQGGNLLGDIYVNVPLSVSFRQDRQVLHLNAGWLHDKASGQERATWGVGSETWLGERSQLIAEGYGQSGQAPYYQAGLRWWVKPQRVQIDATAGGQFTGGSDERWLTLGLRLLSPPFLP